MDVTIEDVAEKAEVSITTVSAVINNTRYVSPELTERVKQAVEELNYHPDQLGRGLKKGNSKTIGLLVSDITNPFFPKVARGVEDCARENNYNLTLCNTDEEPIEEKHYISLLRSQRVDGMIIAPTTEGASNIKELLGDSVPIVLIDRFIEGLDYPAITSDNYNGAYRVIEYLVNKGHVNIGFVAGIKGINSTDQRLEGYRDALKHKNVDFKKELIVMGNSKVKEGYQASKKLLHNTNNLTAIFAANNRMVIGVLQYLKDNSIAYPDDISIVTFDDPEWSSAVSPGITTVSQKPYAIGYKAGSTIFKIMADNNLNNKNIGHQVLPTELVKRGSVKDLTNLRG